MSFFSSFDSSMEGLVVEAPAEINSSDGTSSTSSNSSSESNNSNNQVVAKGKRTRSQRLQLTSPAGQPAAGAASSDSDMTTAPADPPGSATEEEEDMAKCLILLARGQGSDAVGVRPSDVVLTGEDDGWGAARGEKFGSRRFAVATTAATTTTTSATTTNNNSNNGKMGLYVYECRTCNKCFPSFQALGGHRASHKKPKMASPATMTTMVPAVEDKKEIEEECSLRIGMATLPRPIVTPSVNNNGGGGGTTKSRVHECSICGSEFSSGQALGGHMRRHRPIATATQQGSAEEAKKQKIDLLSLDLNLPAPATDDDVFPETPPANIVAGDFPFGSKQQHLLFTSASALVDCHY